MRLRWTGKLYCQENGWTVWSGITDKCVINWRWWILGSGLSSNWQSSKDIEKSKDQNGREGKQSGDMSRKWAAGRCQTCSKKCILTFLQFTGKIQSGCGTSLYGCTVLFFCCCFFTISNTGTLSQNHYLGWLFHRHVSECALGFAQSPGWSQSASSKHGTNIGCWIACAKKKKKN